jgi:hypothetical protein
MENTNCGENCAYVKAGFCKKDCECPYYVETWWQCQDEPAPKLVKDCFPKKFAFEQNNMLHRFMGVQSALENVRNRMSSLETQLNELICQSKDLLIEKYQEKEILEQRSIGKNTKTLYVEDKND